MACSVSSSSAVLQSLKLALSFIPLVENPLHVFTMLMFNPTLTFFDQEPHSSMIRSAAERLK